MSGGTSAGWAPDARRQRTSNVPGERRISARTHHPSSMDLVRFGRAVRALRHRRRWRQVDLAAAAGVSQSVVADLELGRGRRMAVETYEKVAGALDARAELRLSWQGEAIDRLLDQDHAALVEAIAIRLRTAGWDVRTEVSFWIRGERGSVDVVAWHAATRTVLLVEVKSVVPDVQAMLFALDRKGRLGREIADSVGWPAMSVGRLLVIGDTSTARRRVAAHRVTFEAALPDRSLRVRAFFVDPARQSRLRGLIFLPLAAASGIRQRHRIRRAAA
jgi:transcriptional regulator with XRE-family HTH domain